MNTITTAANTLRYEILNGEVFYKIPDVHTMRPFFMTIVSDSNHWLFVSGNGGISAGRKNPEWALFPYCTDDKIIDTAEITGSKTIIRIQQKDKKVIWEPFSVRSEACFNIRRNLYQNRFSNKVIFEEINSDLGLCFQCEWNTSHLYGLVKHSRIMNNTNMVCELEVLDGFQNIMPFGVPADLQTRTSNLADAYKRSELIPETGLGIFALSAIIVDKAEPSEALKANVAWSAGLQQPACLLSSLQLQHFRNGKDILQEEDIKGEKGAYFVVQRLLAGAGEKKQWIIVADVNQNHSAVVKLNASLKSDTGLYKKVLDDIELGSQRLQQLNAAADGFQYTADDLKDTRHFSNVLFNIMRGGIFDNNYQIQKQDFNNYLRKANKTVFENAPAQLHLPGESFSVFELKTIARQSGNSDFYRLATEYLPLKFSRRHGDPSRPWNQFSINTASETDGSPILDYQGNWRDIFQNWEALAHSYPGYIEGMIYKFLNASTFDGYNPYRVTKDGFDWETIEPDNPWSYIGYWGDHQIIYLLKFLEFAAALQPGAIEKLLGNNDFVYAHVPYRIKSYEDIVRNPKDTIEFDHQNEKLIRKRIHATGADGALLTSAKGELHHVNFIEKILAAVLSKLSNFVPEGGIWMNTQRPEWNDANNALVGNGVSMVTLYYLRRFLTFLQPVLQNTKEQDFAISAELHTFFTELAQTFTTHLPALSSAITDKVRKQITDALGIAGSNFRNRVYTHHFSGEKKSIAVQELTGFISVTLPFLEHSIRANRRNDNLYHAYNLLHFKKEGVTISRLSEMLEGQVGVLSSGYLSAAESLSLLDALRESSLYRQDQNSYILYPNKKLNGFLEKNNIPKTSFEGSALLTAMCEDGNKALAERDVNGHYHFNGNLKNAADVLSVLNSLETKYQALAAKETSLVLQIFEDVFNHREFTGRSGTFYGYEGLGSVYWHMVSKLLLAVQETCIQAIQQHADGPIISKLIEHFYEINEGIGVHKSPEQFGAFPITPYSHTPFTRGAQQPGMTGQVKEDILCRLGELGVHIENGRLKFHPQILRKNEFLNKTQEVELFDVNGAKQKITIEEKALLFTYCQVPVMYIISDSKGLAILRADGSTNTYAGFELTEMDTASVLNRTGGVKQIRVYVQESYLRT